LLLLATATACGSTAEEGDQPTSATDSSASASESSSSSSESSGGEMPVGDAVQPGQALIVSTSNVDVETTPLATALVDAQAVDTFVADTDPRLAADVRAAVKGVQVPAGSTLFGSVVSVGCDKPVAVSWETTYEGIQATAEIPKSSVQCLVPVTWVALFLVEDAL